LLVSWTWLVVVRRQGERHIKEYQVGWLMTKLDIRPQLSPATNHLIDGPINGCCSCTCSSNSSSINNQTLHTALSHQLMDAEGVRHCRNH